MTTTFSLTRSSTGLSKTRQPGGLCRFARVTLVIAWIAFCLNTALFPCCEVLAASFGDHSDSVSHDDSSAQSAHHADETHSEHPHHGSGSPCDYSYSAESAINGEFAGLPTDRVHLEWFATDMASPVGLTVVNHSHSEILAPRETHPPPFRLYLRTLRLLI